MTWIYQKEFDSCQECPEFETCYYVQIKRDRWQEAVSEGCINPYIKKKEES